MIKKKKTAETIKQVLGRGHSISWKPDYEGGEIQAKEPLLFLVIYVTTKPL